MADLPLPETADVVIVGSGPAGLSAAVALREAGVERVLVLEREAQTGGIPRHCAHSPYGFREFHRPMLGPAYARALSAAARRAGVQLQTAVTVTQLHPGGVLSLSTPGGLAQIRARAVLLATGARESSRAARLLGGQKPGGVINTGALQGLVHLDHIRPFERPVILGSEMVAFSALLTCRQAGIRPLAMIEPGPRITARHPLGLLARALGVPLRRRTALSAIHGGARVEAVTLDTPDGPERLACDGVIVTGAFRPESALVRASHLALDPHTGGPVVDQFARLSDPAYFAAGNLLRALETAGHCWAEGRAVAACIARALAGQLPAPDHARPLQITDSALAWVMPQRLVPGAEAAAQAPAFERLALRLNRPERGRLALLNHTQRLHSRPERRIWMPLPRPVPAAPDPETPGPETSGPTEPAALAPCPWS